MVWGRSAQDAYFALRNSSWEEVNFLRSQLATLAVEGATEEEFAIATLRIKRMLDRRWYLTQLGEAENRPCSVQTVVPKSAYL